MCCGNGSQCNTSRWDVWSNFLKQTYWTLQIIFHFAKFFQFSSPVIGVHSGLVVSMLDMNFEVQILAKEEIFIEISAPSAPLSQLSYGEYTDAHCLWEDETVRERTGHPHSYTVAKKMKSLTLHTHGCLKELLFFFFPVQCTYYVRDDFETLLAGWVGHIGKRVGCVSCASIKESMRTAVHK